MSPSGTDGPRGNRGSFISSTRLKPVLGAVVACVVALSSFAAAGQATPDGATDTTAAPDPQTTEAPDTTAPPATEAPGETDPAAPSTSDQDAPPTTLSAESQEERARAVANLNLAKSADVEIAERLNAINEAANATIDKIDAARKRIETAEAIAERSNDDLVTAAQKQQEVEGSLALKAVEGFKTRSIEGAAGLLNAGSGNQSLRRNQLLDQASVSTTELLEELRGLLEDQRLAAEEAQRAERDARLAEEELEAELDVLKAQQTEQLGLKAEAERRIDQWAGELTAYANEDAAIQALIGENAAVVNTAINTPTTPSALGFQWPLAESRVTSEYGYRIHPVYGTRRLHAGTDMAAARGTPILASNDGVVIFAGTQGGYGRTVIVDHGGGLTTLYAHMSEIGSTEGQLVDRGDVIGFVGASGTATGNHLHFEVRVNGGPSNPRNYLP